jgi:sphingomyelin phosphodiesterase acid-like 3
VNCDRCQQLRIQSRLQTKMFHSASLSLILLLWAALTTHVVGSSSSSSFLWLSDIHLDPYYGQPNATEPQCADESNNYTKTFGQMGCDSPPALLQSALNEAIPLDREVSFVIITGDLSRHRTDQLEDPLPNTQDILSKVSDHLKSSFPDVTIIPSIGNNDVTPDYYLDATTTASNNNPLLEMMSNGLAPLLETDKERDTFLRGGYFARNVTDTLTVISLNTVIYSTAHEPDYDDNDDDNDEYHDPFTQFEWLEEQFAIAQNTSRSVYLIGHIPPTVGSYRHSQLWQTRFVDRYYSLVSIDYPGLVKGHLYGHLHSDEFRIPVWNNTDDDKVVLWLAPSITPVYGSNPSIRLAHYESDTGVLLDYDTYYLDLKRSDTDSIAEWMESSSFRDSYRVPDLSRTSIERIVTELSEMPSSPLWKVLLSRQHVYADDDAATEEGCGQICQKEWLCMFRTTTKAEYSECLVAEQASSSSTSGGDIGLIVVAILVLAVIGGVVLNMGGPIRFLKRLGYQATISVDEDEDYDDEEEDHDYELPAEDRKSHENGLV